MGRAARVFSYLWQFSYSLHGIYFHLVKLSQRIDHARLDCICFIDYNREMALVVGYRSTVTELREILAVGRLSKLHGTNDAELSMLVSDRVQGWGLGTELLRRLLQVGRDEHLDRVTAQILADNSGIQRVCEKLGFQISRTSEPSVVKAEIQL